MAQRALAEPFRDVPTVDDILHSFLAAKRAELMQIDLRLAAPVDVLTSLVAAGGKRVRPAFVLWAWEALRGSVEPGIVKAAAALELVHSFALIQDDVMDRSNTRRGMPSAHRQLESLPGRVTDSHFGISAAILASDLALVWADELLCECGLEADLLSAGWRVFNLLRSDVTAGQYLDLAAVVDETDETTALRINSYKTAAYTVERPIQLGLALGGAAREVLDAVTGYAQPAGLAFQVRDDLLGAFSDSSTTGKPGDDLASAKPTWLLARALTLAEPSTAARMRALLRAPSRSAMEVEELRVGLIRSGAVDDAERLISELVDQALGCAAGLPISRASLARLDEMTRSLAWRTS